jgi:hypothetical protein
MKRFIFYFGCLIILSTLLISCSNKSKNKLCGDPGPVFLQFYFVDKNDSNLIGKKYFPDSIKLTVQEKSIDLIYDHGSMLFDYEILEPYNNSTYLLTLSKTDVDTINLIVNHQYDGECGPYYGVTKLLYNSKSISQVTGNVYKIVKE